jgi:hypothetical protein
MGWWTCTEEVGKDRAYKSLPATDGFDDPEIAVELFKLGLQWENAWMVRDLHDSLGSAHLIIWSGEYILLPHDECIRLMVCHSKYC